jgi:hypothetical protein
MLSRIWPDDGDQLSRISQIKGNAGHEVIMLTGPPKTRLAGRAASFLLDQLQRHLVCGRILPWQVSDVPSVNDHLDCIGVVAIFWLPLE